MFDMIKKLQEAQKSIGEVKERLSNISVEGRNTAGTITVRATGAKTITAIEISETAYQQGPQLLQQQLLEAVADALNRAEKEAASEMKNVAGALMPGMGGMFG